MTYFIFIARQFEMPDDREDEDHEWPADLPWPDANDLAPIVQAPVVIPRFTLPQLPIQRF